MANPSPFQSYSVSPETFDSLLFSLLPSSESLPSLVSSLTLPSLEELLLQQVYASAVLKAPLLFLDWSKISNCTGTPWIPWPVSLFTIKGKTSLTPLYNPKFEPAVA